MFQNNLVSQRVIITFFNIFLIYRKGVAPQPQPINHPLK
jgi:hypothetical protein